MMKPYNLTFIMHELVLVLLVSKTMLEQPAKFEAKIKTELSCILPSVLPVLPIRPSLVI